MRPIPFFSRECSTQFKAPVKRSNIQPNIYRHPYISGQTIQHLTRNFLSLFLLWQLWQLAPSKSSLLRMRVAKNAGWGDQTTQQLTQHIKTMEFLGVLEQYFLSLSNFTQHRKWQCLVTQHDGQTIQHFTQHDSGWNVRWNVGSFDRVFRLPLLKTSLGPCMFPYNAVL